MAYTGTDLNKAEKGYVDEQDQALQDQIDLADFVTELDANDFDAGSYFKVEDDGSGTNNVFVPKSISEMKADLGFPIKRYKAKWSQLTTYEPYLSKEYVNEFDTLLATVLNAPFYNSTMFTRTDVGTYTLAIGGVDGLPAMSVLDVQIINFDNDNTKYITLNKSGTSLIIQNHLISDDSLVDGFELFVIINKWE